MSNTAQEQKSAEIRRKTLYAAARLFLERGFSATTVRELAQAADVNVSAMMRTMGSKENILCELVQYVLEGQFSAAKQMLAGVTEDPVLFYAAETTLQLYMAESNESVRDLYAAAYSMQESSELIRQTITAKLERLFGPYLPELETSDFYELEIASGGIIRGYMTVPCDMYFTMERKVRRFLETALRIYRVPEEKIDEAITFVSQFDYPTIARTIIDHMLSSLESKT